MERDTIMDMLMANLKALKRTTIQYTKTLVVKYGIQKFEFHLNSYRNGQLIFFKSARI